MKTNLRQKQVLDQQLALSAYLDALLEEPAGVAPAQATSEPAVVEPASLAPPEVAPLAAPAEQSDAVGDGVPDWATSRFQALLFEVSGLTLAVPLAKLKGVVPIVEGLTPMPGHSPLFLGIVPYQGLQSKVVDTVRFVLPADRAAQLSEDPGERATHLVMIDEGRWALACTRIGDVIELDRGAVKWRSANGKRLWLAGTVIDLMCALLDIDQLTQQLVDGMA